MNHLLGRVGGSEYLHTSNAIGYAGWIDDGMDGIWECEVDD